MSHPVWVRGLKHLHFVEVGYIRRRTLYGCVDWNLNWDLCRSECSCRTLYGCVDWNIAWIILLLLIYVAPCMGAWIETLIRLKFCHSTRSRTLYGCVDWNYSSLLVSARWWVAPCMGAWIETIIGFIFRACAKVAPCMGAWIETAYSAVIIYWTHVAPCMGAWIETPRLPPICLRQWVAPCMGAWIETVLPYRILLCFMSHPVWVRGLKLHRRRPRRVAVRRTLYGCVDWNYRYPWIPALR